ncbi:acid protease [Podospora conica]|nr:acid protease [Schizothecium conicum]
MRTTQALILVAWLLEATYALQISKNHKGPRVIGLDIQRIPAVNPESRDKLRRRGVAQVGLDNEATLYFINATIGTPAKSLRLHIDTGSSDLWVNTPSSSYCAESSKPCQYAGTYVANSSSTYEYIGSYFNISYVDGSGASGDYVSDTVTFGSATLDRLQFGIGYSSSNAQGILGIGYEINEVQVGRANLPAYKNLPAQMVADGLIQSNAYSLWLNDLDASTGKILFGGIDKAKFDGSLQTLPIQQEQGYFAEFLITLTGVQLGTQTLSEDDMALAVLLDSGSSLTYLPDNMTDNIFSQVGAQYDDSAGVAYVPCSLGDNKTYFTFSFSGVPISVAMDELVLDLYTTSGARATLPNSSQTACLFGIAPAGSGMNVMGDTFLRSAYVVFDLANNEISLAQTKFNATASSIVEITTGSDSVPGAVKVANPVVATAGIPGGSQQNSGTADNAAAGLSAGTVGAATAVVVAGLVGFFLGM